MPVIHAEKRRILKTEDSLAERSEFELSGDFFRSRLYRGGIRPEFGALFGRREESFQTPDLLRLSTRQ